jgi:hypothetical protein
MEPTARTVALDYSSGSYSLIGNATGMALSPENGAQVMRWTSAAQNQYQSLLADGLWDFSTSERFALDVGYDKAEHLNRLTIWFSSDETLPPYRNFAYVTVLEAYPHLPRVTATWLKSAMTVVGSPDWSRLRHVDVRHQRFGSGTNSPSTVRVYRLYRDVIARPKVILTFDDGRASIYDIVFPLLRAADIRATLYVIGGYVGGAGYLTKQQLSELHCLGWDIANHTYRHTRLAWPAVTYSRAGTAATLTTTEPHGFAVGDQIMIAGCDEAEFNGLKWITGVPNATTITLTTDAASADPVARGYPHIVGKVASEAVRSAVQQNRDWLVANGFARAADHLAFPFGGWDPEVHNILASLDVLTARGGGYTNAGQYVLPVINGFDSSSPYLLPGFPLNSNATAAGALAQVDNAIARQGTVILMGHGVAASNPGYYDMPLNEFSALVEGLKTRRDAGLIDIVTVSEWHRRPAR